MKRLLIAMSAAAMFSLCAKADALLGGIDFESGYTAGDKIVPGASDPGSESLFFWAGSNGESEVAEEETATAGVSNKFLKVETTDDVLVRQTADNASEVKPVDIGDGDITVSAKVQFTAADEAPTPEDGDKLVVWMRAAAEAEGTEGEPGYVPAVSAAVMVTDKDGTNVLTTIAAEDVESFTAAWHTLAIEAVKAGTEAQPTASFYVTLDGTKYGPYKSRVTGGDYCQTISSIGFKGTGAVDDIAFAKNAAAEPVEVTLSVGEGVTLYEYSIEMQPVDYSSFNGVPGSTRQFLVAGNAVDYTVTNATITDGEGDYVGMAVITITVEENLTVTISAGSAPQPVAVDFTVIPDGVTVNGLGNAYYVGDKINPSMLSATSSDPTKRAVVTVKVNDSVITDEYTLQADDVLVVEVTEEYITFALTLPNVANATPTVTSNDVVVADISAIVTGTVVTVTWTADQNYKITAGATETITMDGPKEAAAPTVVEDTEDVYPTYIDGKSQETIDKYKTWAATYGEDTQSANMDAYLLNCAPNAEAVAAAKAAFKFTSITPGQIPTIDGTGYNGVVVILGGTSLSDIATWDAATTGDTFFKATLVVEAPAPAQD